MAGSAVSACGSDGGSDSVALSATTSAEALEVAAVTEPVVDSAGNAWFIGSGDGATTDPVDVVAGDASGNRYQTEVDLGRRTGRPVLIPRGDRVLVATWSCDDSECVAGSPQFVNLQVSDGEIVVGNVQHLSDELSEQFAAPRAAGTSEARTAVTYGSLVVLVEGDDAFEAIEVPEGLGDPCLSNDDVLLSVGVDADPEAEVTIEIKPGQQAAESPVVVSQYQDGE